MDAFSKSFFAVDPAEAGATGQGQHDIETQTSHRATDVAMEDGDNTSAALHLDAAIKQEESNPDMLLHMASESLPPGAGGDASKMQAASKKKKGTASVVKPPKRAKPAGAGGAKKAKAPGAGKKKTAKAKGSAPGTQPAAGDADASDGDDDSGSGEGGEDSDSGPYCICRGPDNHRFMIACDRCEDWFHGECIGMDKHTGERLVQRYICPNCADGRAYVTRYKKTCALERCKEPARAYEAGAGAAGGPEDGGSVFCCDEHGHAWWEQLVAKLPRAREAGRHYGDVLTQEDFVALLSGGQVKIKKEESQTTPWKMGDDAFGVPSDFWDTISPRDALSEEEVAFLSRSALERQSLGEEIVLCRQMLQLVELAAKRREACIATSVATLPKNQALGKDFCGYDFRLDVVGATGAFGAFAHSPAGEAVFRTGRLDAPESAEGEDAATAGMCTKKKCKPHAAWSGVLIKSIKQQMKELAAQAKEKLDAEVRMRDGAAVRYRRRMKENNWVTVIEPDEMDVGKA